MWQHRFRMEQRWLGRKDDPNSKGFDDFKFENTFRYLLKKSFIFNEKLYGVLQDEIHLRMPPPELEKIFDQNRIYAGIGYNLDKNKWWRIETGYMLQTSFNSSVDATGRRRVNNVFRITITSDAPFKK